MRWNIYDGVLKVVLPDECKELAQADDLAFVTGNKTSLASKKETGMGILRHINISSQREITYLGVWLDDNLILVEGHINKTKERMERCLSALTRAMLRYGARVD